MSIEYYIPLTKLCTHYKIEMSFFNSLDEFGLVEITTIEKTQYIHQNNINNLEKMIRIHNELDVNMEGIDIVFNLLQKIEKLQNELNSVKSKLESYEDF